MMHLELRLLRYFTAIANEGSFTRCREAPYLAARALEADP